MTASTAHKPDSRSAVDRIWFTRCPVPTATGLAHRLGWLEEEFATDGIPVSTLQEQASTSGLGRHHYDHELPGLIREGGNLLALAARAQGAPTRLIGLTWIDEAQSIIVRPDSAVTEPKHLKGLRVGLPAYNEVPARKSTRGSSIGHGMALHGFHGALAYAGLTLQDVKFVELASAPLGDITASETARRPLRSWWGLNELVAGKVDAVYVKGAAAQDAVQKLGLRVGIDLDKLPERRFRVNNGTPRPITVHQDLLDNNLDLVARFLYQSLRAAEWAKGNLEGLQKVLQSETRGSSSGVTAAYRDGFHLALHPDLSAERLELFRQQKDFLWLHGILDADFDVDAWADPRPLEEARRLLAANAAEAAVRVDLDRLADRTAPLRERA